MIVTSHRSACANIQKYPTSGHIFCQCCIHGTAGVFVLFSCNYMRKEVRRASAGTIPLKVIQLCGNETKNVCCRCVKCELQAVWDNHFRGPPNK